jgi:uncharacterized protein
MRCLCLLLQLSCATLRAQEPTAITKDTAPDTKAPSRNVETVISSHGSRLMGMFMLAPGAEPHGTVILLHGFPGYEQNMDLAQALRRAGWHVLAMHYRGAWVLRAAFPSHTAWRTSARCLAMSPRRRTRLSST